MRTFTATLLAASLFASSALAAPQSLPLPAGKPAGVKEAAFLGPNAFLLLMGAGLVIGGISLTLANNTNRVTSPTTTSTSTTGLP